jgi:hypothetical protein
MGSKKGFDVIEDAQRNSPNVQIFTDDIFVNLCQTDGVMLPSYYYQ